MPKFLIAAVIFAMCQSSPVYADNKDELAIRALIAESTEGFKERDLDKIHEMYNNQQLMFFDVIPPFKDCCGVEHAREKTTKFLAGTVGPVLSELRDLEVHTDHDMAYTTATYHLEWTATADSKRHHFEARITDVWRRLSGRWSIVHEHCSVPASLVDWMKDAQ